MQISLRSWIIILVLNAGSVNSEVYLCDPFTNTLTLEKEKDIFTVNLTDGMFNMRGKNLPDGIPVFSQLSLTLPKYDLFVSPNGTLVTASPFNDKEFQISIYFPNMNRRWFWFSTCRLSN